MDIWWGSVYIGLKDWSLHLQLLLLLVTRLTSAEAISQADGQVEGCTQGELFPSLFMCFCCCYVLHCICPFVCLSVSLCWLPLPAVELAVLMFTTSELLGLQLASYSWVK